MRHRLDLGLALAGDEWIIANTNDISAVLWCLSRYALDWGDMNWLRRHGWPTYFRPGTTVTFPKLSRITREPSVQVKFPKARGLKPA